MSKTPTPQPTQNQAAQLIRQMQARLLALSQDEDALSVAEIERTAKAITQLITSVEKSEAFLRAHTQTQQAGDRIEGPARREFLMKLKRMVDNGYLDELND